MDNSIGKNLRVMYLPHQNSVGRSINREPTLAHWFANRCNGRPSKRKI